MKFGQNSVTISEQKKAQSAQSPNDNLCNSQNYYSLVLTGLLGVAGALLVAAGAVLLVYFPSIVRYLITQELQLSSTSKSFKLWEEPPPEMLQMQFYFFNLTNVKDFTKNQSKPVLDELGPYVYSQKWKKTNITWHSNGTVSYVQTKEYFFEPSLSKGKESDRIFTVNIPMLTAAIMFTNAGGVLKMVLNTVFSLSHESFIMNATVRELLWVGYDDLLMKAFRDLMPNAKYPHEKFAYFYGRNGSHDGIYNIYTGVDDIRNFTIIDRWEGKRSLDFWDGEACNMINGSAGEAYPPWSVSDTKPLRFFSKDLCRSMSLQYSRPVEHLGIAGLRFEATPDLLASGDELPENACFCLGHCLPSGVYNISACQYGAPITMSMPHFLWADPRYAEQIEGMHPNESLHTFYVDIEPQTGVPMELKGRMQINAAIQSVPGITYFKDIENTMYPILWFVQSAEITPEIGEMLDLATRKSHMYGKITYYTMFAVGSLLMLVAVIYYVIVSRRRRQMMKV